MAWVTIKGNIGNAAFSGQPTFFYCSVCFANQATSFFIWLPNKCKEKSGKPTPGAEAFSWNICKRGREKNNNEKQGRTQANNHHHIYTITWTRTNNWNHNQFGRCKILQRPHISSPASHGQVRKTRSITSDPYLVATISSSSNLTRPQLLPTIAWRCLSWVNAGMDGRVLGCRQTRQSLFFLRCFDFA